MKFILVALAVLSASCATYRLQTVSQPKPVAEGLTVEASALLGREIQFDVKITNQSGRSLTIDSKQFRLYAGDPNSWHEVFLIPSDEYYNRAEAREYGRPALMFSSTEAPVYHSQTTIISSGGSRTVIVRQAPQPVTTSTVTIVPQVDQNRLAWLKDHLFYSVTLEPGKEYQGLVFGETAKGTHYKLVIVADGKTYEAVFERVKDKGSSPFMNLN